MEVDFDWVATVVPMHTPTLIGHSPARNTEFKEASTRRITRGWLSCTPRMSAGPGVMHTKVFVVRILLLSMKSECEIVPNKSSCSTRAGDYESQ
jgi:hypothetical protein